MLAWQLRWSKIGFVGLPAAAATADTDRRDRKIKRAGLSVLARWPAGSGNAIFNDVPWSETTEGFHGRWISATRASARGHYATFPSRYLAVGWLDQLFLYRSSSISLSMWASR
jgi:hypothetical protein